jgi:S-adenosylmethionine synthetase
MVGYATNETEEYLAAARGTRASHLRELDNLQPDVNWLGADGKAQVSVVYDGDRPLYTSRPS